MKSAEDLALNRLAEQGHTPDKHVLERPSGSCKITLFKGLESRPLVIFAHGTGNDPFYPYLSLLETVLNQKSSLCCFTLDGHGAEATSTFNLKEARTNVDAVVDFCKRNFSEHTGIKFLGHSLGAALILKYLEKEPSDAFLISTPFNAPDPGSVALFELLFSLRPIALETWKDYSLGNLLPALGSFRRGAFPVRVEGPKPYLEQIIQFVRSLNLMDVHVPTGAKVILAHGILDFIAAMQDAQRFAAANKNCEVINLGLHNHYTSIFAQQLRERVKKWLD